MELKVKRDRNKKPSERELRSIIKDIGEGNEPSCMDKILKYFQEKRAEDCLFMELLVQKLTGEEITWFQPWYQQCNSLSRPLKRTANQNGSESYLTGTISKAESNKIKKNWKKFMKIYEVPDKLICLARWKNTDKSRLPNTPEEQARRFVVAFLSRGLQRTLYQVFRHIMTHYGCPNKGAYSKKEEKLMEFCFENHPNDAVTLLSSILKREPRGIYKRLQQQFQVKPDRKRMKWTLPLSTKYLKRLLRYTHLPLEELKNRPIEKDVFLKLSKKFDHNYTYLRSFWYESLHVQLFLGKDIKKNKLRQRVFKKLRASSYQAWTDIRWKEFVTKFPDGLTHRFLYKTCRGVICSMRDYLTMPLSNLADRALEKLRNYKYSKLRLKRLCLNENGDLVKMTSD